MEPESSGRRGSERPETLRRHGLEPPIAGTAGRVRLAADSPVTVIHGKFLPESDPLNVLKFLLKNTMSKEHFAKEQEWARRPPNLKVKP